jgi:phage tail-like protein
MPVFRNDPYPSLNFEVVIPGISEDGKAVRGAFSEVSGLGVEIDPIEYRTGAEANRVRKLPGLVKYPNLVLKRGIVGVTAFWKWLNQAATGQVVRATVSIVLLDENHQPVMRWNAARCWPCKWTGPTLSAVGNEVAIESLELAHEGIELDEA